MKWGRHQSPMPAPSAANETVLTAVLTTEELTRIFIEIRPSLERVIERRILDRHTAQDLVQDIYLRLGRVSSLLSGEEDARRYLMRMAVHAALYHLRSESNRAQLLAGSMILFEGHVAEPEEHAHARDQMSLIEATLAELPAKCRDVLYLTRVEGLPREEVAARLGVSLSLVNKYVLMALKRCAQKLEER
ncbi:sigma-70 family RNA polymerase sigma factor|uniref:RNA polymerase sigma factor n=1 Tax=Stenotrophomonas sp. SbOxS2 TaxID=2723885 RepID=UPI0015D31C53|nr:sigma-70 family RNA polymerase sigma factor [Stenotrophomonas sp. SbOxS2]NYT99471.1 sigma-70 family RNA polymerase sigma factor [Stenotrophomonas sp. SbOxS2]